MVREGARGHWFDGAQVNKVLDHRHFLWKQTGIETELFKILSGFSLAHFPHFPSFLFKKQ
jgi:hypothetical protein